ncbi:MAG: hypothetical protein U5K69_10975 [Balneolaceae bacterium]|nr:hypothetical protein [Balneolaceae bacterium]
MYNDKEIKQILSRAHELQQQAEGTAKVESDSQALSLEEIKEVARESGLSAEYVQQAAIEFEGVPVEEPFFLDTGNSHEVELLGFAKGELNKKTWAELRSIIEYHFDSPGKVTRRPDGIVWEAKPQGILKFLHTRKSPKVDVSGTGTKTTIRIKQNLKTIQRLMVPGYAAFAAAAGFAGVGLAQGAPEGFIFGGVLLGVAKVFQYWTQRKKQKARKSLKEAMEQLQTIVTRRFTASQKERGGAMKNTQIRMDEECSSDSDQQPSTGTREKTIG